MTQQKNQTAIATSKPKITIATSQQSNSDPPLDTQNHDRHSIKIKQR
ncbi:hypothetical protein H6F44_17170 [Pseudanabaena sp. FACHB-1277]|uniref:Uncharacterized protein n=1 Tax=Pseudanabaena cinerea FACHB-1277 TaxID=2949581 RepID=A0A926UXG9_9CYAN|nr:hypothetical protein [Pseudanabaena cinerea]MBD2151840.1 hypothetical protein [Pseudanabaena cinerea FACHB-1277]